METLNKIFINRRFNCSATVLFSWLVQPQLIAKWFGPKNFSIGRVQIDLRVGGKYSIELKKSENQNFFIEGEYIEINDPKNITFSFQYKGLLSAPPKSIIKIMLEEITQDESLLSLIQDFEFTPSDMDQRTKSWEYMLQVLGEQISFLRISDS